MSWKHGPGGNARETRTTPKSIRGQISRPIPIVGSATDEELTVRDQPSTTLGITNTNANVLIDNTGLRTREQDAIHYLSGSSGTGDSTFHGPMLNTSSQSPAHASVTQNSSVRASGQQLQSSMASDVENRRDSQLHSKPQRRKSGIRSALSKIFGRKSKSQAKDEIKSSGDTMSVAAPVTVPNKQRKNDSTSQKPMHIDIEPNRSFSLPVTEYDRALRSHSIGPDDVLAIQSARNSLSAELMLSGKYSSILLDSPPARPASSGWAGGSKLVGLSPRPASSQDRPRIAGLNEDSAEIGGANSGESQGLRRRSRSLTMMSNFERASASIPQGVVRRRSAEIRHWRGSYAAPFMSPVSTTADEELMQLPAEETEKPRFGPKRQPVVREPATTTPPVSAEFYQARENEGDEIEKSPRKSPVKSTDYAAGILEPRSVDSRVSNLETRMTRLEGIVLQLGNSLSVLRHPNKEARSPGPRQVQIQTNDYAGNPILLQPTETGLVAERRHSNTRPLTSHSDASKTTFGDVGEMTPRATMASSSTGGQVRSLLILPQQRGTAEVGHKQTTEAITPESYTTLLALLKAERSAREALETHVRSLDDQLQLFNKSMAYTNTDQSDSPSLNRSLGEASIFDHDEDDHGRFVPTRCTFNTSGLDNSAIATDNRTDDECTDSFATPAETSKTSFDVCSTENESIK